MYKIAGNQGRNGEEKISFTNDSPNQTVAKCTLPVLIAKNQSVVKEVSGIESKSKKIVFLT